MYNIIIQQFLNIKIYTCPLMGSTVLVSCSKLSRNRFARFDPNRFRFDKWNTPWLEFRDFIDEIDEIASSFDLNLQNVSHRTSHGWKTNLWMTSLVQWNVRLAPIYRMWQKKPLKDF